MVTENDIGTELETYTMPVERGKIAEFADATFDENSIFYDPNTARTAGYEHVPAPLTFLESSNFWSGLRDILVDELELHPEHTLHGEQRYEYHKPVVANDTLTGVRRVSDMQKKEGQRGGMMTVVTLETEYRNQNDNLVAKVEMTVVETGGPSKD